MSQVDHYPECSENARSASLDQFVKRWPGHFLLVNIPGGEEDDWDMDFKTDVLSIDKLASGLKDTVPPGDDDDDEAPGTYLFEIKKHADNSWLEWIAIGRARNNDLVVRHQSVSKLHARIHGKNDESDGSRPAVTHWLTDMRSTAGTIVNDSPLRPSEPYPLSPGDEIRFGQVVCEYLDSAALHRKLGAVHR